MSRRVQRPPNPAAYLARLAFLTPIMSQATAAPAASPAPSMGATRTALAASLWRAPLVPLALAFTAGILADRYLHLWLENSLWMGLAFLSAWAIMRHGRSPGLALVYLWASVACSGAAYHHWYRDGVAEDDIGHFAGAEPRVVRLRGEITSEPVVVRQPPQTPLQGYPRGDFTTLTLRVTELAQKKQWQPVSGNARLTYSGTKHSGSIGSRVEVAGQMILPAGPANPGEFDYAAYLRDQRIGVLVMVRKTAEGFVVLEPGSPWSVGNLLARVRAWANQVLKETLPADQAGLASALLLGDSSALDQEEWDKYLKTGVIHALAISGQHLAVLAVFAWLVLRLVGVRRRNGAIAVALFLLGYALLTGGRPPVMRSAWMVLAVCGGLCLLRPVSPANCFALAWLLVAFSSPTDIFTAGCLLSFLAVAVLFWGTSAWQRTERDPLEELIDQSRPLWLRGLRWLFGLVALAYLVNLAIWLAVTPLVAARFNLVSLVAVVIGPPVVLLTSLALLTGFLLLLLAPLWPLTAIFAFLTRWVLAGCTWLVDVGINLPAAYHYVPDVPTWWLWLFYAGLLTWLTVPPVRRLGPWALGIGLAWYAVWLAGDWLPTRSRTDFHCTFLAVGHGGCTVLETPDGRTLVYDTGAMAGPDVTRRHIAPFLWSRGVRRIDEVILSHADLDHFNGLLALLDRFAVSQITLTPTFEKRPTKAVELTLQTLKRRGVPQRVVKTGDFLYAGEVSIAVLHPPTAGPPGEENVRSLVLLVRHGEHRLLLTGDLEGLGLTQVLPTLTPVDVLMAPHHGSPSSEPGKLADRTKPKVVVSCQGKSFGSDDTGKTYEKSGAVFLATWPHGAVTFRSGPGGLWVETFVTRKAFKVR